MSDTTGRGGVGIRLFVSGGEVVRRTFDQVGDSGRKMWAQIALGDKSANPAIRALSIGAGEARQALDGLTSRAGGGGAALAAFGVAGIAAAAALGGLVIALGQTREAMSFAADLTDTADRIGVGVEALQQWRYVADEAGVSVETFQANLEKVNGVLGAFKNGLGDARLKPIFEELGISKADLDSIQTADQFMLMLADSLGQIEDRATQVRLARGLGVEDSLPILRLGSERITEMKDAAVDLGVVLEQDTVKRLDEADRKMELATQQMKALTTEGLQPLATWSANAASYLAGLSIEFSNLTDRAPGWINTLLALGRSMPGTGALQRVGEMVVGRMVQGRIPAPNANTDAVGPVDMNSVSGDLSDLAYGRGAYRTGGFETLGHTGRGGSRGGGGGAAAAAARRQREEEAEARDRERATAGLGRDLTSARRDLTRLRWDGDTPEDRAQLAKSLLALDQQERDAKRAALRAELERTKGLTDAVNVQLEQLAFMDQEADALADRQIIEDMRAEQAQRALEREEVATNDAIALLDIQGQLARTGAERFEIGKKILLAEQALERLARETQMKADGVVSEDEQTSYDSMIQRQAGDRQAFDFNEEERLRDQFHRAGEEVVRAIEDGRIGEYIGDKIKTRLLDGALDALFNTLGGGGGAKGGGLLNSVVGFGMSLFGKGGGRAAGGGAEAGFAYRTAEHGPELFMLGGNGHVTNAAETAKMVRGMAGLGDRQSSDAPLFQMPSTTITIDATGADAEGLARVERALRELNENLENRAVEAMNDYRQRTFGRA